MSIKIQSEAQNLSIETEVYSSIIKKYDELQIQENEDQILRRKIDENELNAYLDKSLRQITFLLSNENNQKGILERLHEINHFK